MKNKVVRKQTFARAGLAGGLAALLWVAGVQAAPRATSFAIQQTPLQRLFTPNGDGVNDKFSVPFTNPSDSLISVAKIYDIFGAEVGDFQLNPVVDILEWDGHNKKGSAVPGGVYFYRIEVEQTTFSGVVVVAK